MHGCGRWWLPSRSVRTTGIAAFGSWICGSNGFRQIGLIVFRKSCFREVLRDAVASPARQGRETLAPEPMQLSLPIVESLDG